MVPVHAKQVGEAEEEYEDQYDENTVATTEDERGANELSDDDTFNIIVSIFTGKSSILYCCFLRRIPMKRGKVHQP